MRVRSIIASLFCCIILLNSCAAKDDGFLGYDISRNTTNIDPQFYSDKTAHMLILNIFEGLVTLDSSGDVHPGMAKSWAVSADGMKYTFKLRQDSYWPNKEDTQKKLVTAKDFEYAFKRLINPEAPSPHAGDYLTIKNAKKIMDGLAKPETLGAVADSNGNFIIELEYPDSRLLEKLAAPAAMPCNEDFFKSTKGRYGLDKKLIAGNGPFTITRWEETRITLTKNPNYAGETLVKLDAVDLYIDRQEKLERFLDDRTQLIKLQQEDLVGINTKKYIVKDFEEAIWCIAFNMEDEYLSNPQLRRSIALATDTDKLDIEENSPFKTVNSIFSNELIVSGKPLPDYETYKREYNKEKAVKDYYAAMEALGLQNIASVNMYIPEGEHKKMLEPLQTEWKSLFNLYVTFTEQTKDELDIKLRSEDFDAILLPIKPNGEGPEGVLEQFTSNSKKNHINYNNAYYDITYSNLFVANSAEDYIRLLLNAEHALFDDAAIIPLYSEKGYYVMSASIDDIDIYYAEDIVRFHKAKTA